jgi:CMP-N-acetylneuraminic acid synthetase
MKNINEVGIIVQARLSSQRCPQKMIRPFAGTTLMDICLTKLVNSKIKNHNIWVSVYEQELLDICKKYPINIFRRSEKSAMSEGTPMTEIYEWWDQLALKHIVMVNACTPLLKQKTIEQFYFDYCATDKDGMFGVIEKKNYYWDNNGHMLTPLTEAVMNTKTTQPIKEAAHCLYASKLSSIGDNIWMGDFRIPNSIELYTVSEQECFDIDYEWQFIVAEKLYNNIS